MIGCSFKVAYGDKGRRRPRGTDAGWVSESKGVRVMTKVGRRIGLILLVCVLSVLFLSPDAYAKRSFKFTVFIGADVRLKLLTLNVISTVADTSLADGPVSVTLITPSTYKLRPLGTGDYYYLDRGYTLTSVPGFLSGKVWIVGRDDDKLNNADGFLQFEISDTARVYVFYDGNAPSLPGWMTTLGFAPADQTITTSNPVADTLVGYLKIMTKGVVRLGGNDGTATGAQCNYVVVVRRPVNGDLGDPTQLATTLMQFPRMGHRVVAMNTGRVLVMGGIDTSNTLVAKCELYDTVPQSFSISGMMVQPRNNPAVVTLNDGRILAIGGDLDGVVTVSSGGGSVTGITALESCEIYDPSTQFWTATAPMAHKRRLPEAITLADGRVFVSGGVDDTYGFGIPYTEVYDPGTNTWTAGPTMLSLGPYNSGSYPFAAGMRYGHRMSLLADGRVLIAGGMWHGPDMVDYAMDACEIYDPASNAISMAAPMTAPRSRFGMVDLGGGKIAALGGLFYQAPSPPMTSATYVSTSDVEIYDAATNTWSPAAQLPRGMYDFAYASPAANRVVVFDGYDVTGTDAGDILLYDGVFNTWSLVGSLVKSRSFPFSNGAGMVTDVGGKDYFLCGGVHLDEAAGQSTILSSGERFKY